MSTELKTLNGYGFDATKLGGLDAQYYAQGRASYNLLDNSNFADLFAQAGLNGAHGSTAYIADRWIGHVDITPTIKTEGILLTTTNQYAFIQQRVKVTQGKTYTLALSTTGGTTMQRIAVFNTGLTEIFASVEGANCVITATFEAAYDDMAMLLYPGYVSGGGSAIFQWAALYEGAYDATTLPAYQPKGYAAELAECQRYYYQSWDGSKFNKGYITREAISASSLALIEFPTEMRIVPTITFYTAANETGVVKEWTTSSSVSATQNYTSTKAFGVSGGSNFTIGKTYFFHYTASADL